MPMQLLRKGTRHQEPKYWESQCNNCGSLFRIEQWYRPTTYTCSECHHDVRDWVKCDKDGWVETRTADPPLLCGEVETNAGVGYKHGGMGDWWAPQPDGDGHYITGTRIHKWRFLRG